MAVMWIGLILGNVISTAESTESNGLIPPSRVEALLIPFQTAVDKQPPLSLGYMQTLMKGNVQPCHVEQSGNKPLTQSSRQIIRLGG